MKKVGRNEPCPCGSGIKFKKCCGNNNVIQFNPSRLDEELEELSAQMIEYGLEHYKDEINQVLHAYGVRYEMEDTGEDKEHFIALLLPWILLHEPLLDGQTLYDVFMKDKMKDVQFGKGKEAFQNWKNAASSFFEIISVETTGNEFIHLQDIVTNERFKIKQSGFDSSLVGNIIVGTILPGVFKDHLFYVTIGLPKEMKQIIQDQSESFQFTREFMNEKYPFMVALTISPVETLDIEWADPIYEEVIETYFDYMENRGVDEKIIADVLDFWINYSTKYRPIVRKKSVYVAALTYLTYREFLEDSKVTQKMIAEAHGVSSATISSHYKKFIDVMHQL